MLLSNEQIKFRNDALVRNLRFKFPDQLQQWDDDEIIVAYDIWYASYDGDDRNQDEVEFLQELPEKTQTIRTIITSHSNDNLFDYCPRKFEFMNLHDRRPPREPGHAAGVGTALHDGMQAWLIARAESESELVATQRAFMAMLRAYPWDSELEQNTTARSVENTCLMLYEMIRDPFWNDWELMYVDGKGWAVEVPFLIRHTSLGVFTIKSRNELAMLATQGKIDMIMRNKRNNRVATIDIKTTIIQHDMIRSEFTWSGQQIGYSHVAHQMTGIAPGEFDVFYYICRFSATEYPSVYPMTMQKDQDSIDDYWMGKLDRLSRMKMYAENDFFPRTNGGCNSWGKECACFSICPSRDPWLVKRWFETMESEPQQGYDYWVEMEL